MAHAMAGQPKRAAERLEAAIAVGEEQDAHTTTWLGGAGGVVVLAGGGGADAAAHDLAWLLPNGLVPLALSPRPLTLSSSHAGRSRPLTPFSGNAGRSHRLGAAHVPRRRTRVVGLAWLGRESHMRAARTSDSLCSNCGLSSLVTAPVTPLCRACLFGKRN